MPHAENTKMPAAQVNGDKPSSLFLSHLISYPVIDDSITGFKKNPYGQKSLSLADQGYVSFAKPLLPYLARPYSILSPYVAKADSFADMGLSKIDQTFPVIKTPTDQVKGYAFYPLEVAGGYKDHVLKTWSEENKKNSGSVLTPVKAVVTTSLNLTSETLGWVASKFSQGKAEAEKTFKEKTNN